VTQALVDAYFSRDHLTSGMINKGRFLSALSHPPTHTKFPHASLIHAVCAVAARFIDPQQLDLDKESYWKDDDSPADYHAKRAKMAVDDAIVRGKKLFQVAQAVCLICESMMAKHDIGC
jgi:hypothetical protein